MVILGLNLIHRYHPVEVVVKIIGLKKICLKPWYKINYQYPDLIAFLISMTKVIWLELFYCSFTKVETITCFIVLLLFTLKFLGLKIHRLGTGPKCHLVASPFFILFIGVHPPNKSLKSTTLIGTIHKSMYHIKFNHLPGLSKLPMLYQPL